MWAKYDIFVSQHGQTLCLDVQNHNNQSNTQNEETSKSWLTKMIHLSTCERNWCWGVRWGPQRQNLNFINL